MEIKLTAVFSKFPEGYAAFVEELPRRKHSGQDARRSARKSEGSGRNGFAGEPRVGAVDMNETPEPFNGVELSESVLARDWNSPEEDAAWANL